MVAIRSNINHKMFILASKKTNTRWMRVVNVLTSDFLVLRRTPDYVGCGCGTPPVNLMAATASTPHIHGGLRTVLCRAPHKVEVLMDTNKQRMPSHTLLEENQVTLLI